MHMRYLQIVLFMFLVQIASSRELKLEEEDGYLKITEFNQRLVADSISTELGRITYIKGTRISSIQLVNNKDKRAIIITTEELIPAKGKSGVTNKTYTFNIKKLKTSEREIDAALTAIKNHLSRMQFKE